jgi:antiphage defense system Thoeris ThsB-like protein
MSSNRPPTASPRLAKLYVSYHHDGDSHFYREFCRLIKGYYEPVEDTSVERTSGSTDSAHVIANLRENYLADTVCTVVLCGLQTAYRRFVDWEIKASLDLSHGLVAIILPENLPDWSGRYSLPPRLENNLKSGYAECLHLVQLSRGLRQLGKQIEVARARPAELIKNSRPLLGRSMLSG